jgi:hypothetical protein
VVEVKTRFLVEHRGLESRIVSVTIMSVLLIVFLMLLNSSISLRHTISSTCSSTRLLAKYGDRYPTVSLDELLKDVLERPDQNPPRPAVLKNKYYGLRHGESEANIAGIISSNPIVGARKHGLTSNGIAQARNSAKCVMQRIGLDNLDKVVFLSSYYKRARETGNDLITLIAIF